jgi:RNA polymerase sigma-70 factor (family 1)
LDQNLIAKLKKGDNDAFKDLFNSFYPALCNFANTFVHDVQISEDFVQEVFISLWDYKKNFNDLLSLKSFLYKSVRNKSLNYLKHQKIIDKHFDTTVKDTENDAFYFDHIIEEETHRLIYNAINELPQNCKKILLLSINGLSNPEIAEDLNISVNTVKTQKAIAYKHLRIKLKELFLVILSISLP